MKFPMFSSSSSSLHKHKVKTKIPSESATPTLRCILNGPFRDLHFTVTDHRITPVHDVVFLDEVDNPSVKPLIYRPKFPETEKSNGHSNGITTTHECHKVVIKVQSSQCSNLTKNELGDLRNAAASMGCNHKATRKVATKLLEQAQCAVRACAACWADVLHGVKTTLVCRVS
ncbi:uncharacterized protein [Musca autumnalis]|uniref:uncharacterized protein n=1 Tax=Musca autumnalis TaxID=221902 RepID=UPI003CEB2DDF